ncbi:MAG: outer membrane protein [Gammaproteobacteria bacterium]
MFKKIILATALISASAIQITMASPVPYVGVSTGITTTTGNHFSGFRGMSLNMFAGYGGIVSQSFYLAGELTGTLATAEVTDSNALKTTYGYALGILPGIMLSDHTLAFARVGIARARFSEADATRTGGQIGLGLQTSLTQNVDLRGEYDFTAYQSVNRNVNGVNLTAAPRNDAFTLGLIYKID